MRIVESFSEQIERNFKQRGFICGEAVLDIATGAAGPQGIQYDINYYESRSKAVDELATMYRISGHKPLLDQYDHFFAKGGRVLVERWLVRITEQGKVVDQELAVNEWPRDVPSTAFIAPSLRQALGLD